MKFTERRDSHFYKFEADGIQAQKASADLSENLGPRVHDLNGNCLIDFGTKLVL